MGARRHPIKKAPFWGLLGVCNESGLVSGEGVLLPAIDPEGASSVPFAVQGVDSGLSFCFVHVPRAEGDAFDLSCEVAGDGGEDDHRVGCVCACSNRYWPSCQQWEQLRQHRGPHGTA